MMTCDDCDEHDAFSHYRFSRARVRGIDAKLRHGRHTCHASQQTLEGGDETADQYTPNARAQIVAFLEPLAAARQEGPRDDPQETTETDEL